MVFEKPNEEVVLRAIDPHHVGVGRAVQTTQNGGARGPPAVFELFKILERGTLPSPVSGRFKSHLPWYLFCTPAGQIDV